jgi:O-acetylserine/cysteine efflux transporter
VGYGIWNRLLGIYPSSAVVPFTLLVPVVGMTTAWLALGEVPSPAEVAGGLLLLGGVATAVLRPGSQGATPGQRPWHAQRRDVAFAGDLGAGLATDLGAADLGAADLAAGRDARSSETWAEDDAGAGRLAAGARVEPDLDAGTRP